MRISDWSSDVCSSDLNAILQPAYLVGESGIIVGQQGDFSISVGGGSMNRAAPFILHRIAVLRAQPGGDHPADHRHGDDGENKSGSTPTHRSSPCSRSSEIGRTS